jgi:hypothetical protein
MNTRAPNDDGSFDLIAVEHTDKKREMQIKYRGVVSSIKFRKASDDPSLDLWLAPGDEVSETFGDKSPNYLGNFLGVLLRACHAQKIQLPLLGISLPSIHQAVVDGKPFGELISDIFAHKV